MTLPYIPYILSCVFAVCQAKIYTLHTIFIYQKQYKYIIMCICSVPCEDDEERRGSLTTARRGSRLSDIIQMQVGDGGDGQDEDDDVNYIYCDDNDTFL